MNYRDRPRHRPASSVAPRSSTSSAAVPAVSAVGQPWTRPRLERAFDEDPAFRTMSVDGIHWLDPFSRSPIEAPFDWRATAIAWLMKEQPWKRQPEPASPREMLSLRWFLVLREKINDDPALRFFLPDGRWLNPLDGTWVDGVVPKGSKLTKDTLIVMAKAMGRAEAKGHGPALVSIDRLRPLHERAASALTAGTPAEDTEGIFDDNDGRPDDSPTVRQRRYLETQPAPPSRSGSSSASRPVVRSIADTVPDGLDPSQHAELRAAGFRVEGLLGKGGMGAVFSAVQLSLERPVALKVRVPAPGERAKFVDRFLREARAAAVVQHPHVVTVYDVGRTETMVYMAMELLSGGDAAGLVERSGVLDNARAVQLLRQSLEGLRALHQRDIIHRDLKPSNLFLTGDGLVKIGDLGIALDLDRGRRITAEHAVLGTPVFMPPEQSIPGSQLDQRSDLYSLAITFYYLLSLRLPYLGDTPMEVMRAIVSCEVPDVRGVAPAVDARLALILRRMMAKEPADRFADAQAVLEALAAFD